MFYLASFSGTNGSRRESVSGGVASAKPDWYEELEDEQISMFKKVFLYEL